jgi:hypothetical protein
MRALNAVLVILVDIVVMICAAVVFLVTLGALQPGAFAGVPWLQNLVAPLAQSTGAGQATALVISGIVFLLGLIVLIAEFAAGFPRRRAAAPGPDGLGPVVVDDDLIRELANREAWQVPGVQALRLQVKRGKAGLRLNGQLSVEPLANIAEVARDVRLRVRAALERAMGERVEEFHLRCTPVNRRSAARSTEASRPAVADVPDQAPASEPQPAPVGRDGVTSRNGTAA